MIFFTKISILINTKGYKEAPGVALNTSSTELGATYTGLSTCHVTELGVCLHGNNLFGTS